MSSPLVSINQVRKKFADTESFAIEEISAELPAGKIIGLVGPDGAGKTTLLRLLAGLLTPTSGQILIDSLDSIKKGEEIRHFIGYMPQKFGLYEDLTVQQNLNLYANLKNVSKEERKERFVKLLKFTNLAPFTERLAGRLSGGMKQKLGIACALIKKPRLLLLDEASVGVDPISRRELWAMVYELLQEGITVVWSTAYLDEAEKCDLTLLLSQGKMLFYGKPADLTERVEGKVFLISEMQESKRKVLSKALSLKGVIDGVIQGKNVRIVTAEKEVPPPLADVTPTSIKPRFEDAFIDILGGGPGGGSRLAETMDGLKTATNHVIVAENLVKEFGSFTAVKNISFSVACGEIFGLLGPNGAGKSTTFKMLCGLLTPTGGRSLVNGKDLQMALGPARAHIGYMAQKFSLYGNLTVFQNLSFYAGIYNLTGKTKSNAIKRMVEIFDLAPFLHKPADKLPFGFKQRLSLAAATMHSPEVLFLDEPTSGVDPITRREFWNHINGVVEKGVTVMVTTHFMDEAEYCDRIALIYQGEMIQMGPPDELKEIVRTAENSNPTLEDAFIKLIQDYKSKEKGWRE